MRKKSENFIDIDRIKSITLVFENCDYIDIDINHISRLNVFDVSFDWSLLLCSDSKGEIYENLTCTTIVLYLNDMKGYLYKTMYDGTEQLAYKRILAFLDITSVCLNTVDDRSISISVPWDYDAFDTDNSYQDTRMHDSNIYIEIKKRKKKKGKK